MGKRAARALREDVRRSISTVILASFLSLAFLQSTGAADGKPLRFRGKQLVDKTSGLLVLPKKSGNLVAVSSTQYHYWLALPYSEKWTFESTTSRPLEANDDRYRVTLASVQGGVNDAREHLEGLLAKLLKEPSLELRNPSFFEEQGRPVLRHQARVPDSAEPDRAWEWHYWTVATHAQSAILLHLSTADPAFTPEKDEQRLRIYLGSLRADFQVEP